METTVALMAHDEKKAELARFIRAHSGVLGRIRFIAPEDTARALEGIPITIHAVAPDAMGGDLHVGAAIVDGLVDALIFLQSPVAAMSWEPDLRPLLKVCDLEGIPVSTNVASAEILIHHFAASRGRAAGIRPRRDGALQPTGLRLVAPLEREDNSARG
jgi:methylglyoxal synthase